MLSDFELNKNEGKQRKFFIAQYQVLKSLEEESFRKQREKGENAFN